MQKVIFEVKVPVMIKKKAKAYVSSCAVLDVHSQGETESEARKNIAEAVRLFLITCLERGTLDNVLRECGFKAQKKIARLPKDHRFITVPIPFDVTGGRSAACHA